jgi:hypothetical protein
VQVRGSRAAPQYTHRLFGQISGVDNRLIILTFHIGHGQVGNSPREAQLLEVDLRHRNGSGRNIVLAGGNASENFTQRSCLVPDLKSARRAQTQQQLVVESDDSTARPELEWRKIFLRCNHHVATLPDLFQRGRLRRGERGKSQRQYAERHKPKSRST